jgi:hypothetical protein
MDKQNRRQAVSDYKDRKIAQGIFAVRCVATGEVWVGTSPNLEQTPNRLWFGLRQGGHPNPAMRAAWATHGEGQFAFEVLETVTVEDLSDYARRSVLKDRDAHWRAELGAAKIVG